MFSIRDRDTLVNNGFFSCRRRILLLPTQKGVRKLHHPSRLTYIKSGFEKTKQKQEEIRLAGTSSECSVASMGFSTRVTNALLANGLDTIAKACNSIENAQSIPGLGLASYEELLSVLLLL